MHHHLVLTLCKKCACFPSTHFDGSYCTHTSCTTRMHWRRSKGETKAQWRAITVREASRERSLPWGILSSTALQVCGLIASTWSRSSSDGGDDQVPY